MKKILLLLSLLFLQQILFAQKETVLQLNTFEGAPIAYARVTLPQATFYTSELGKVTLTLALGDSFTIVAFGYSDTTIHHDKEAELLTLSLLPKQDTLTTVNLSTTKSERLKVGGKKNCCKGSHQKFG